MFQKATRSKAKLRLALIGPSGSGKTFTALKVASYLGGRVALIDTEHGAASKYSVVTQPDAERGEFDFDTMQLDIFAPKNYIDAMKEAEKGGYDILIIDSLSHAWTGKGGVLEMHDNAVARQSGSKNSFTAWKDVTPQHNALVEAILQSRMHVIATVRSKTEYVLEEGANGKKTPRKVGMAPVQRDGLEYEFDLVGDMDLDNRLVVSKSRCHELSAAVITKPGKELAERLNLWLKQGRDPVTPPASPVRERQPGDPDPEEIIDEPTRKHLGSLFNGSGWKWADLLAKIGAAPGAKPADLCYRQYEAAVAILSPAKAG